jgi:superfamily II DNA or RNA helicase
MPFPSLYVKAEYRSLTDNIVKEFYIPFLNEAIVYKRAVGFFSSSALSEISKGINGLLKNNGTMQLVASPYLSEEDLEAIQIGYDNKKAIIEKSLINSLQNPRNYFEEERLNILAHLIAEGKLNIKIAILEKNRSIGIYHEKLGLFYDREGNTVAFAGSMNESSTAMNFNYESIDVFCSWHNNSDADRVRLKEAAFEKIWGDNAEHVSVMEFPEIEKKIFELYKRDSIDFSFDMKERDNADAEIMESVSSYNTNTFSMPGSVNLYDYQKEAIDKWEKNGFHGIFDMATGTGKTFTGLAAILKIARNKSGKLAVIVVCPFQHLVEQWVEDMIVFGLNPIIGYSGSSQKNWKKKLQKAIFNQKLKIKNQAFFCFICTNATFSSEYVQNLISKVCSDALLVVDEAHNFGAEGLRKTLTEVFNYRLGLSATFERHNDEIGTQFLVEYFGSKCIEYPLERAIDEKKLTPYKYFPIITTLTKDELKVYQQLSYEISKCIIKGRDGKIKLNERGKRLALQRARLIAAAEEKISKLKEIIKPYKDSKFILVYCGAARMLNSDADSVGDEELRQIDAVTHMLGNILKMKVSQFTSREDIKERQILKNEFKKGDNLQVLVAIKCLDEGVNIPAINVAFILASTTNPKEYIQRRGRVLRLSEGKRFAEIYDFITIPRPLGEVLSLTEDEIRKDLPLIKNEIVRAREFSRIAMNSVTADHVINSIIETYSIQDDIFDFCLI